MSEKESYQLSNLAEDEFGQLHALHLSEDGVAAVRAQLGSGPSLSHCEECGEEIPEERRIAVKGCRHCIYCKSLMEKGLL